MKEKETLETKSFDKDHSLIDQDQSREWTEEPSIPITILQKMNELSSKIQILRKEHAIVYDEVKGITDESFLGAIRHLGSEYDALKKKYLNECSERKRLYNEVIDLKGNIRVFCRCRPLNQEEIAKGCTSVVECSSSQDTELQIVCSDSSRKQYKFDHVFGPQADQESVFAQTSSLVTSVMDGFNVCIFAYGQTGTGKTFTMEGTPESRGVNYRTLEDLFRISEERAGIMKYEVFVSMLEVYNEKIRDLLAETPCEGVKKLDVKQTADGTQDVPGLREASVYSVDDVWEQLKTGSRNRAVGSTNFNELSSRSHCLLRVTVRGENLANGQKTRSNLWLVDLAGSERLGRTEVEGERLKESQFINKSLSALGDVISALASKSTHIPYRNSKLTHLLQSSLGGDCKTLMIVQISPGSADVGETLCSLNFASRVRGIEQGPAHKQADHHELIKYKQMAEKQKQQDDKELWKLRNNLQLLQLRFTAQEQNYRNLQQKARDLESQLAEERKARVEVENRALTASNSAKSSSLSFLYQNNQAAAVERPPLRSSMLKPPFRGITNLPSVPEFPRRTGTTKSTSFTSTDDKENLSRTGKTTNNIKSIMQPRRVSIAMRPPQPTTQHHQPRRRVSIATVRSDSEMLQSTSKAANSSTVRSMIRQPKRRVSIATSCPEPQISTITPQRTSRFQMRGGSFKERLSLARTSRRLSRLFSPVQGLGSSTSAGEVAVTPVTRRNSPLMQVGSWKPRHPTVVALQKRHVVWSPLKEKLQKADRKLSMPSQSSGHWK